jgi:glycosyltransferase involved in cell wall biosynthesis
VADAGGDAVTVVTPLPAPPVPQSGRRPLRVLQVIDDLGRGGAQAVVLAALRLADPARLEMRAACVGDHVDAALLREMRRWSAGVVVLGARRMWDVRAVARLAAIVRRSDIDVVHTHLAHGDALGGAAARLAGRPVVSTLHAVAADRLTVPQPRRAVAAAATRRLGSRLIAVSEAVRDSHVAELGLDPARLTVLRNVPVAPLILGERGDRRATRARLGVGEGPVVCVAARLAPPKDHDTLLRALPDVLARHPDLTLLVAGDGPRRGELEALARSHGVDSAVRFLGLRTDVPELLAAADVVCNLTHEAEGLSITVLDALSLGRPVVATRIASVEEVIAHGRSGMLVAPRDVAGAASALLSLLGDSDRRRRIGDEARGATAVGLDGRRWMAELERVYAEAAGVAA